MNDRKYEYALKVWDRFGMKTMEYYYDLYLKCDVLLLLDAFETFTNCSLKNYG